MGIEDAGIVEVKTDPVTSGDVAPDAEGIPDKSRHGLADLGGVAGVAGVAFAVDLHVVGPDPTDDVLDHLGCGVFPYLGAVRAGVEIEMNTEVTVRASQALGNGVGGGCRGREDNQ